jgi:hypothetical protein
MSSSFPIGMVNTYFYRPNLTKPNLADALKLLVGLYVNLYFCGVLESLILPLSNALLSNKLILNASFLCVIGNQVKDKKTPKLLLHDVSRKHNVKKMGH